MFGSFYSFPKTPDFGLFTLHFGLSHYFILFFNFGYYLGGKKKKKKWLSGLHLDFNLFQCLAGRFVN